MAGEISINGESKSIPTPSLLDYEARLAAEKRELISRVTLEIEEIFIRENLTMGDLGEIMDMFNSRAHSIFSKVEIKTLKDQYGKI